ncbi:MAG: Bax inhibitor-1/YccA family protein [Rickettsiales bacterium]
MSAWDRPTPATQGQISAVDQGLRSYLLKIYNYMASALLLTGVVAYFIAQASVVGGVDGGPIELTSLGESIFLSPLKYVIMLAPLGMVIAISAGVNRMQTSTLQLCFWAFSALMGLSLASILLMYTGESVARTFFVTAAMFGGMSMIGYTTKRDLTGMGHFMMMGVWGLVVASLVNLFLNSSGLSFAISIIGVVVFTGLIAYDTQKLKSIYYQVGNNADSLARASIMGALSLYLDFINLFISLLRLMGDRR